MSAKTFTDRQGQYLAFIDAYTRVHGWPPAESDMQHRFGVSPPSVHQMVLTLERLGPVRRQPGVARSIEVLLAPEDLPVLRHPEPVKSSVPENLGMSSPARIRDSGIARGATPFGPGVGMPPTWVNAGALAQWDAGRVHARSGESGAR